jgi:NADPH:quinone reductase-like Zn-dependent oxidoreductase
VKPHKFERLQASQSSMRYTRIIVTHFGGPDALRAVEEECPEPKTGEVRVRVLAAGVALPDVMAREGVHPETPPVPFTPGWDLVGVVDRIGEWLALGALLFVPAIGSSTTAMGAWASSRRQFLPLHTS